MKLVALVSVDTIGYESYLEYQVTCVVLGAVKYWLAFSRNSDIKGLGLSRFPWEKADIIPIFPLSFTATLTYTLCRVTIPRWLDYQLSKFNVNIHEEIVRLHAAPSYRFPQGWLCNLIHFSSTIIWELLSAIYCSSAYHGGCPVWRGGVGVLFTVGVTHGRDVPLEWFSLMPVRQGQQLITSTLNPGLPSTNRSHTAGAKPPPGMGPSTVPAPAGTPHSATAPW